MAQQLDSLVRAMSSPSFYASLAAPPASVDVVQTHISWVFLAGDEVFKLKKPVHFSFLDFSALERRRHFCHEEVRLNRRLAPDVYVGVVGLCCQDGAFAFCAEDDAAACEYAVRMRRLPHERLLPQLLARRAVDASTIDAIVARLVEFHSQADHGPAVRAAAEPARVVAQMRDDFAEMNRFRGVTVDPGDDDRIRSFCIAGVERRAELLRARSAAGRVRDGHGDLHAEHICLRTEQDGGIAIFDCIEFDPALRCRDVAAEIAFLAMDLEFRGRPDLARSLVGRYAECSGDPELPTLVPLFACHRAYIRGKVDSLKSAADEVGADAREEARASARRHFALAHRYTWSERPGLIVINGLSGTGKSTLARALAARTGFAHLASDEIRKQIAGLTATSRVGARDEAWLYSGEMSARTYAKMYARAAAELARGGGVIVDATFQRRVDRDAARDLARDAGRTVLFVECSTDEATVVRRLRERARANDDASDADEIVYRAQRAAYQPYAEDEAAGLLRIDMGGDVARVCRDVEREMEKRFA